MLSISFSNGLPVLQSNIITDCGYDGIALSGQFSKRLYLNQEYLFFDNDYNFESMGYSYKLVDDLIIKGKVVTVDSGATIDLGGHQLLVNAINYGSGECYDGYFQALHCNFINSASEQSQIYYEGIRSNETNYICGGEFAECSFQNIEIYVDKYANPVFYECDFVGDGDGIAFTSELGSQPTIQNNSISNYEYPFLIQSNGLPVIENNTVNCNINRIALAGEFASAYFMENIFHYFADDYLLGNYGYSYDLIDDVFIIGKTLIADLGTIVYLNSKTIHVQPLVLEPLLPSNGNLNAESVTFYGDDYLESTIRFNGNQENPSSGALTNCQFTNVKVECAKYAFPDIRNCNFNSNGLGIALCSCLGSNPVIESNTIENYEYPFYISSNADLDLNNNTVNNCGFAGIGISGDFARRHYDFASNTFLNFDQDYILRDHGYPYQFTEKVQIKGKKLVIDKGLFLSLNGFDLYIMFDYLDYTTAANGDISADLVYFTGDDSLESEIFFKGTEYYSVEYKTHGQLDNCHFNQVNLNFVENSDPTVSNCTFFSNGNGTAIKLLNNSQATIQNSIVSGYANGIENFHASSAVINSNDLLNCTDYAVYNRSTTLFDISGNYWGHITGPTHPDNPGGKGQLIHGNVNFIPFLTQPSNIQDYDISINEIMYAPASDNMGTEFIEIYNNEQNAIDLHGWMLNGAVNFTFPDFILLPNEYVIVCRDSLKFVDLYGIRENLFQWVSFQFESELNELMLFDDYGALQDIVEFGKIDPWPTCSIESGHSIELIDVSMDNNLPESWQLSDAVYAPYGTPGCLNSVNQTGNHSPYILSQPDTLLYTNSPWSYPVQAVDQEQNISKYLLETNAGFLKMDSTSGILTGTPTANDTGSYYIKITVQDLNNAMVVQEFMIRVISIDPKIVINELYFGNDFTQEDSTDFVELINNDTLSIDLGGWNLSGLNSYTFNSNTILAPGEFFVIRSKQQSNSAKHSQKVSSMDFTNISVTLKDVHNTTIDSVDIDRFGSWYYDLAVGGCSAELVHPSIDNNLDYAWLPSEQPGGTPGQKNSNNIDVMNYPPSRINLISPNGDTVATSVEFHWESAYDYDGDIVNYTLMICGTDWDTTFTNLQDTMFVFNVSDELFTTLTEITWSVYATDEFYSTPCMTPYHFYIGMPVPPLLPRNCASSPCRRCRPDWASAWVPTVRPLWCAREGPFPS